MMVGRHTDVDDLILNTSGVAICACIVFLIRREQNKEYSSFIDDDKSQFVEEGESV
jgi:glycopeptide antibiotics resistance protein